MRRRPPDRVQQIVGASLRVFGEKGFRRTQMADVAREMGVSPGTLYNYVTGKEALFYLMIDRACLDEPATDTPKFPLPAPAPVAIIQRLRERLRADVRLPSLAAVADSAMQRHLDPDPVQIGDEAAREAVVDFVVHALLPTSRRTPRQHKER